MSRKSSRNSRIVHPCVRARTGAGVLHTCTAHEKWKSPTRCAMNGSPVVVDGGGHPRPAAVGIHRQRALEAEEHQVWNEDVKEALSLKQAREATSADRDGCLARERFG